MKLNGIHCNEVETGALAAMDSELTENRIEKVCGYFGIEKEAKKELVKAVLEVTFMSGFNAGMKRAEHLTRKGL
jgi:hypothetical protein